MQRMPPSSLRPRNSEAQRCGQRWSMTPTRPALSRNAISFSPSSISRTGAPSRTSSEDCAAGIQYCRINSPMTVPGPTCVSSLPSVAVVILPSRYGRAPLDGRYLITDRGCLVPPSLGSGRPLIGPEAGRPDHLAPLLGFRGDMLCEVGRRTAIGQVHHVDAGHYFEQLAGDMRPGAVAGRRHIELARIRLGIGDEFGDRLRRKRWMHLHAVILVADARNRRDVTDEIVFELLVERRVDRVRYVDQKQRIAIGGLLPPPPRTCS